MRKAHFVLTACALAIASTSACAANVELYGIVDTGLVYTHVDKDDGSQSADNWSMGSGISRGSRFGIRGTEDLGDGVKVGFVLENGFESDSGSFASATGSRFFGREAMLYVEGSAGKLAAGRLEQLSAGFGTWGIAARNISPFAHGWAAGYIGGYKTVFGFNSGRIDNAIAYKTPTVSGFTGYAAYSTKTDNEKGSGIENKSSADRYAGIGLTYQAGRFTGVAIVETINWSNINAATAKADDAFAVTIGGNYGFDFGKVFLAAQYFDNVNGLPTPYEIVRLKKGTDALTKGWGLTAGTMFNAFAGSVRIAAGYRDAELVNDSSYTAKRMNISASYQYPLSKKTYIYFGGNYTRDEIAAAEKTKPNAVTLTTGLSTSF